jgi:hypothetical protein
MPRAKPRTKAGQERKIARVMHEYKAGTLKSGGKRRVRSRKQAVAIAMSEAGRRK